MEGDTIPRDNGDVGVREVFWEGGGREEVGDGEEAADGGGVGGVGSFWRR